MLTILGWLFVGLLAGAIGQAITPKGSDGIDGTVLLGIAGAFAGGLTSGSPLRAAHGDTGFLISLGLAVLGAVGVLVVYRLAIASTLRGRLSSRGGFPKPPIF